MSTLRTIARLANVSVSTVSRALNDSFDISPGTKEHVLQVAEECGYFREKKRIRQENRRHGIHRAAILCPEIESMYYSHIVASLIDCLRGIGAESVIYDFRFDQELFQRLLKQCCEQKDIDMIFCLDFAEEPNKSSILIITVGRSRNVSHIADGLEKRVQLMADHIYSLGCQTIGFLGEDKTTFVEQNFVKIMECRGLKVSVFRSSHRFEEAGRDGCSYFLSLHDLPDMIVCAYDEIAYGLIDSLLRQGINVPGEVSVAGMNGIPTSAYCFGGLTTIETNYHAAFEQVLRDMTEEGRVPLSCYQIEPQLRIRYTTTGYTDTLHEKKFP